MKESEGIWINLNSQEGDSPILGQNVEILPYCYKVNGREAWILGFIDRVLG